MNVAPVAPVVSIIVATHDKPDALSICLTSLKLQTYGDFECVGYEVLNAEPRQCAIDSAGWLCRRDVVERTPWPEEQRRGPAPDG